MLETICTDQNTAKTIRDQTKLHDIVETIKELNGLIF